MGGRRVGAVLVSVGLLVTVVALDAGTSAAQAAGSNVTHEVTPTDPGEGGQLALEDATAFAPDGGDAIFEPGTASEEHFTYSSTDGIHLLGVSRPHPINHPQGSFVAAQTATEPTPTPTVSAAPEESPPSAEPQSTPSPDSATSPTPSPDVSATVDSDITAFDPELELEDDGEEDSCELTGVCALQLTEQEDHVTGAFSHVASLITFNSELTGPGTATLNADVNGIPLQSTIDMTSGIATWTGNGHALFLAERDALVAFGYEVERQLVATRDSLLPHEHLLHRSVLLWAEAPLGEPLVARNVAAPEEIMDWLAPLSDPGVPEVDDCAAIEGSAASTDSDPLTPLLGGLDTSLVDGQTDADGSTDSGGTTLAGACQRADDDGIRYWGCGAGQTTSLDHDAKHCFLTQTDRFVGPCTNKCKGRCGPGCGWGARDGVYSRDCGEHDQCCRIHGGCANPWDSECGDEYFDADDDFMWGRINCKDCGEPSALASASGTSP